MDLMHRATPCISLFDVDGDKATLGLRWSEYLDGFEIYVVAMGINDPNRQKCLLLHLGGQGLQRLAKHLDINPRNAVVAVQADPDADPPVVARPAIPAENPYTALKRALTEHFRPQANKELSRVQFGNAKQAANESIDQFHGRLRNLVVGCEYLEEDGMIKSQVIKGTRLAKLRTTALEEHQLTLDQLLAKGRAYEGAELQKTHIEEKSDAVAVNRLKNGQKWFRQQNQPNQNQPSKNQASNQRRSHQQSQRQQNNSSSNQNRQQYQQNQSSSRECRNCGFGFHQDGREACPARDKVCRKCTRVGHYARCCISSTYQQGSGPSQRTSINQQQQRQTRNQGGRARLNVIADQEEDELEVGDGDDELFGAMTSSNGFFPAVELRLLGKQHCFLLDTGAASTIISLRLYRALGQPELKPTSKRIFAYNQQQPLQLKGEFLVKMELPYANRSTNERVFVSNDAQRDDVCVLGYDAARRLKLVSFSPEVRVRLLSSEIKNGKLPLIGKMKGVKIKLHIDKSVPPVAVPYRVNSSIHLEQKFIEEVKTLDALGLTEPPSGPTDWVNMAVMALKPNGDYRLALDMRNANKAIKRVRYNLPTVDDILHRISGSTWFSILDLNSAFHQLELDESCRYITVFSTPLGPRQMTRLFFGVNCATEIFHNAIANGVGDCPGVIVAIDDLCVHGKTLEEHDNNLLRLQQRLDELNLTVQEDKKQLRQQQVKFWGLLLTDQGVKMDPAKVAAVARCKAPTTVKEAQSFLGMVNYCARFVPNQADLAAPIRRLCNLPESDFDWSRACERSFQLLQKHLTEPPTLAYFNIKNQTELVVDASPIGLGAVLMQIDNQGRSSVVAYASKTLTPTEQRYSQIEREAYAVVWGLERFRFYLLGSSFVCWTDHKALVPLFNNPNAKLPIRMDKWMLRVQGFNMTLKYLPGSTNAADYLSRHPDSSTAVDSSLIKAAEHHVRAMIEYQSPSIVSPSEIAAATQIDPDLQIVISAVEEEKQYKIPQHLSPYSKVFHELPVQQGLLLRGTRICVPVSLQTRVIELAHEGHQGAVRTKQLLRSCVWFPKLDTQVEAFVKNCAACIVSQSTKSRTPLVMSKLPGKPWTELSMDFYTFPDCSELLVVIDDFSRFPVVVPTQSTAFRFVEEKLSDVLSTFGVPVVIRTDNGPPFNGKDFAAFADRMGFKHRKVTYAWPEANGEAERFMRTLSKVIRTASATGVNWMVQVNNFLRNYRLTPHPATGFAPAELLFGRLPPSRLPHLQQHDGDYKRRIQEFADKRRRVQEHHLLVGDKVFRRKEGKLLNKTQPFYEEEAYTVVEVNGSAVTARNSRHTVTRNSSFFRKVPGPVHRGLGCFDAVLEDEEALAPPPVNENPPAIDAVPQRRNRGRLPRAAVAPRNNVPRQRSVPARLRDYVLDF